MKNRCIECKGKGLCGRARCPILEKFRATAKHSPQKQGEKTIFGASPPAVFVGRYGYPEVSAGPMIPPLMESEDAAQLEDPHALLGMGIDEIIQKRCQLVRANTTVKVKQFEKSRLIEKAQEMALSRKPVDTEVLLSKPLKPAQKFDGVLTPMGPAGKMESFDIAENPKVPGKVDYLTYDTDVKATDAALELYGHKVGCEHITRLLSIGLLGQETKLVPTRWAITATDDMVGKELSKGLLDYPEIKDIQLYSGGSLGNHFEILLIPRSYSFELLELWMARTVWSADKVWIGQDMEGTSGKKGYSPLAGGYYAARLPVLEKLENIRKQAAVFAIREITPDYWAPLGVWVVREAARNALSTKPDSFETLEEALMDMSRRINTPFYQWREKSELLPYVKEQTTLSRFLS
ncbi:hypothetical protein EFE42_01530 [Methanohalophilus sp. RSK]|uniref:Nre family DNA repair protein n=1 Tax=Methanohalophilus sp. RSK TaxID=2485783 RepID=UPI000F43D560|nr:Nre family DNA repair protein [Methanohalophilus sp. RSK]RNI15948.1 hypothetical protein EFE42_01530 [Methanohalophilus sp. RSK]